MDQSISYPPAPRGQYNHPESGYDMQQANQQQQQQPRHQQHPQQQQQQQSQQQAHQSHQNHSQTHSQAHQNYSNHQVYDHESQHDQDPQYQSHSPQRYRVHRSPINHSQQPRRPHPPAQPRHHHSNYQPLPAVPPQPQPIILKIPNLHPNPDVPETDFDRAIRLSLYRLAHLLRKGYQGTTLGDAAIIALQKDPLAHILKFIPFQQLIDFKGVDFTVRAAQSWIDHRFAANPKAQDPLWRNRVIFEATGLGCGYLVSRRAQNWEITDQLYKKIQEIMTEWSSSYPWGIILHGLTLPEQSYVLRVFFDHRNLSGTVFRVAGMKPWAQKTDSRQGSEDNSAQCNGTAIIAPVVTTERSNGSNGPCHSPHQTPGSGSPPSQSP